MITIKVCTGLVSVYWAAVETKTMGNEIPYSAKKIGNIYKSSIKLINNSP